MEACAREYSVFIQHRGVLVKIAELLQWYVQPCCTAAFLL